MSRLRLHRVLPSSKAEGPGCRFVLWVQGCSIRCKGCAVPGTWSDDGGFWRGVDSLVTEICETPEIEGVTFLGGEPFDQAGALAELAGGVQAAGFSVLTFTGYDLAHLKRKNRDDWNALLAATDLLIDGPFDASRILPDRPWIGSSNQRFHFLTDHYADLKDRLKETPNRIEVRLSPDGEVSLNGMAPMETWNDLVRMLRRSE